METWPFFVFEWFFGGIWAFLALLRPILDDFIAFEVSLLDNPQKPIGTFDTLKADSFSKQ